MLKEGKIIHLTGFLGPAYLWVKAAHIVFVIFWMGGLFLLPRFYVYHQETAVGSPDDGVWIERETRVRAIILKPAMLVVWGLGLMLGFDAHIWGQRWFAAKLAVVAALTGYQAWLELYGRKLAAGERSLSGKALRMLNEVPSIAVALIVILVVVRPF